jgi:hypothetical protein
VRDAEAVSLADRLLGRGFVCPETDEAVARVLNMRMSAAAAAASSPS